MIVRPPIFRLSRLALNPKQSLTCQSQRACVEPKPFRSIQLQQHSFSTTSRRRGDTQPVSHYDVLGVAPNATKAELKKRFYQLSKETHPDLHKNDPTASQRFSQISESYSILGDEEKRRRYDRDFVRQNQAASSGGQSGTYAGSRPASGLSKRRGTFRGAPQSFYAQGGYGNTGRQPGGGQQAEYKAGTFNASAFTERGRYETEFDPDPVFRTQSAEDAKRSRRMQAAIDMEAIEHDRNDSIWVRFVIVSTIVLAGVTVGTILVSMKNTPRGGMTRSDGSRRDGPRNEWAKG